MRSSGDLDGKVTRCRRTCSWRVYRKRRIHAAVGGDSLGDPITIDRDNSAVIGEHAVGVVQYRALQGRWKEKKLSGNDKLSGLGDTRVNNCTVLIFNYLILFS